MVNESDAAHEEKDALLPDDSPHNEIYRAAVPIWCGGKSTDDLDWEIGDGYACGFSDGFESAIIMAMLRPEWAQGLYHRLRQYYLTTHTPDDLLDWERCADSTARAIPVSDGTGAEDGSTEEHKLGSASTGRTTAASSIVEHIRVSDPHRAEQGVVLEGEHEVQPGVCGAEGNAQIGMMQIAKGGSHHDVQERQ